MPDLLRFPLGEVTIAVRAWRCARPVAPAVVLLHGTGATAEDWDVVAATLSLTRAVHAVDLRGHGRSDRPGTYSVEAMAEDVTALLARLGEPSVDLVGHSLGGLVALRVAAREPDRVRRLVLEDVGMPHRRAPAPPERPPGELAFDWAVVEQVRPQIDEPGPDWPAVIASVHAPTLVIAGGPASFVPAEHIDELVAALPDARSVTVDAGHEIHATEPRRFLDLLGDALGGGPRLSR